MTCGTSDVKRRRSTKAELEDFELDLPSTEAKKNDSNFRRFVDRCRSADIPVQSVECEALPPSDLRGLVSDSILDLIDVDAWDATRSYEEAERTQLAALLGSES